MRVGSLFAGIGGFDLAARWMGWQTAWVSEIDPYASAVLKKHWPDAPNLGDITTITNPPPVDVLVGGFPCQDISLAGKGEGIGGARSGLWKHYARLIEEIRPRYVVAENVSALRSRGLEVVLGDLAEIGYDAEWHCIPASAVGAPHRRDRIWIVAYPQQSRCQGRNAEGQGAGAIVSSGASVAHAAGKPESEQRHEAEALSNRGDARLVVGGSGAGLSLPYSASSLADSNGERLHGVAQHHSQASTNGQEGPSRVDVDGPRDGVSGARDGVSGAPEAGDPGAWWAVEPNVGRVAHGVPRRVDRLKCLGNAIVPQVAYTIFQAIARAE
jgi:DNA (cytosine-5)-methyltransferase 1